MKLIATATTAWSGQMQAPPKTTTTPSLRQQDLKKRDQVCGILNGYTNAQAPSCTGQASQCTSSAGRLGCCDDANNCTFHTSCNGGFASPCTESACLQCPSATPYCARYVFTDGSGGSYEGYGCGVADVSDTIIYGSMSVQSEHAKITQSSSLAISSTSPQSSLTAGTSLSSSSASSTSKSATSASSFTGGAAASSQRSKSSGVNKTALGAGIAVGVALAILLVVSFILCRNRKKRRQNEHRLRPQLQQGRPMSQYSG